MRAQLLASTPVDVTLRNAYQVSVHATRRRAERAAVYDVIWAEAAERIGASYSRQNDGALVERGGRTTMVRATATPIDGPEVLSLAYDKARCREALLSADVPVPDQLPFSALDPRPAIEFLAAADSCCVVKPAAGAGGDGVTAGVRTRGELLQAVAWAARFARHLVLERQVTGDMYRALILDGEPLAIVRRNSPAVHGDGRSTVGALLLDENQRRLDQRGWGGLSLVQIDLDLTRTLADGERNLRSVPASGSIIRLKTSTSQAGAEDAETVQVDRGGQIARYAAAAAAAVGLRLAGVDLVTPTLDEDLCTVGGSVIEVNGAPGLHFHYQVRDPATAQRVAIPVLERLLGDRLAQ